MKFERGWLIGDPHLGRKFEVGVPAHRRGEREIGQLAKFVEQLGRPGDMIVMVGDLFDNPYVSHTVVKQAIDAVIAAAEARPKVQFVMMAGNHDMPRKITATAAFDVFRRACGDRLDNLEVLVEPEIIDGVAFFPWQWDVSAVDQVEKLHGEVEAVVGHWDLASFGGEDLHLAPVAALRDAFGDVPIYSGHYHTPGDYQVGGQTVHCTGSLEPYGHGEDPKGLIYRTMTLAEATAIRPYLIRDKCIRLFLKPGEEKPQLDVLALTVVREEAQPEDGAVGLSLDKFDWSGIVSRSLAPLTQEVRSFIQERLPSNESSSQ